MRSLFTATTGGRGIMAAALIGTMALLAACGPATTSQNASGSASASAATSPPATSPASSGAPTPSTSTPAATGDASGGCTASQLRAQVGKPGGTAGSIYYPVNLTNISGSPCSMYGYPGVSFVTGPSGSQIGAPASRNRTVAPATVRLAPGATGHATLQIAEAGNYSAAQCHPVSAHWLKIFPPDQTAALYTRFTAQVCSAKLPASLGSQLSIMVIRPGTGQAGNP